MTKPQIIVTLDFRFANERGWLRVGLRKEWVPIPMEIQQAIIRLLDADSAALLPSSATIGTADEVSPLVSIVGL